MPSRFDELFQNAQEANNAPAPQAASFDQAYQAAVARQNGIGGSISDPVTRDLIDLTDDQIMTKYGPLQGMSMINQRVQGVGRYQRDRTTGGANTLHDNFVSAGIGFGSSVEGIVGLAAGVFSDEAGAAIAQDIAGKTNYRQSTQSDALIVRRRAFNAQASIEQADSAARAEQNADGDSGFIAGLKQVGRDTLNAGSRLWDDPASAADATANGVGSLLLGGPLRKGAVIVGEKAVGGLLGRSVISEAAALRATAAINKHAMIGTIAVLESGGAYQQTVNHVMQMSHAELMLGSKDYRDMITSGMDPIEIKTKLAGSAGLLAAAMTAPAAAAAGKLVSRFEAQPFKAVPIGSAVANVAREGVEEGLQSGTAQFANNVGVRTYADENQSLTEGVGEQAGVGAVAGLGSAGVIQAPAVGAFVVKSAGQGTLGVAKAGYQAVSDRVSNIKAANAAASPVSVENINAAAEDVLAATPEVQSQVDQEQADGVLDQVQAEVVKQRVAKLSSTIAFDPTELDGYNMSPEAAAEVSGATNKFDALHRASLIAGSTDAVPEDRVAAGLFINDVLARHETTMIGDLSSALDPLPEDHPITARLRQYEDVLLNIQRNPEIQTAMKVARDYVQSLKSADVSESSIATPSGQQAVQALVSVAQTDPGSVDPDLAGIVLEHARKGRIALSRQQTDTLASAAAITRVGGTYKTKARELKLTASDIVSKEILNADLGDNIQEKSAAGHVRAINMALQAGNATGAAEQLQRMINFAQHMQNKVEALNRSYDAGNASSDNTTKFQALTPNGKWMPSLTGVWLDPKHTGSVKLAQKIALDAGALGEMANELALMHPELGVAPVKLAQLNAEVNSAPANEIARKFRKAPTNPTPTAVQSPDPVKAEPKAQPEVKAENKATETAPEAKPAEQIKPEAAPAADPVVAETAQPKGGDTSTEVEVAADPEPEPVAPSPEEKLASPISTTEAVATDKEAAPVAEEKVEPAPTEQVQSVADIPGSISEAYPNLIGLSEGPVKSWFEKAYTLPKTAKSRLFGTTSPIAALAEALSSDKGLTKFVGESVGRVMTPALIKSYDELMNRASDVAVAMDVRLTKFLTNVMDKKSGQTFGDALLNGRDGTQVNELFRGKALNIAEVNDQGDVSYNQSLKEAAVVAGLQWVLSAGSSARTYDSESVAKILGIDESQVTQEDLAWLNGGLWLVDAKRSIGDKILQFWGVTPNANTPIGYTKGVAESVAAEVIQAMQDAGLVAIEKTDLHGKTYKRLVGDDNEAVNAMTEGLAAFPTAIEEAVMVQPEDKHFIGEAPTNVPTHQMHGSPVKLSQQQQDAAEAAQNTPYQVNPSMLSLINMLGQDGIRILFGKGDPLERGLNGEHAKSIDGFNRTLASAYSALTGLISEMQNRADAQGERLEDQQTFFRFSFTSVGRLQMLGRANPQASKLVREVLLPTWSTLDVSDRTGDQYKAYMLAMAQHLGIKVHKELPDIAIAKVEAKLTGELGPIVEMLHEWRNGEANDKPLDETDLQEIRDALGGDLSFGAVHALMDYGRFLDAKESGESDAFRTALYLEADGVTDGPINALMNFVSGDFTTGWIDLMNRGGFFLGSTPTSLADFVNTKTGNAEDLYQKTTNLLRGALTDLALKMEGNAPATAMNQALVSMMVSLLPSLLQVDPDTSQLTLDRGITKNPLTVTVYGSGAKGIANKITSQILDALYERLSSEELSPELKRSLLMLTTRTVERQYGKFGVVNKASETNTQTKQGAEFKLTPGMISNLQTNVMELFSRPLRSAIEHMMGDALPTADLVRKATQIQSIHMKYAFRQAVADALATKDGSNGLAKDFLSQAELDKIMQDLLKSHPMIATGTQDVFVGGSSKADVETSDFGRDFSEELNSPGYVWGPENSGVSGIPFLVIATGDGQMILNASTMDGAPENTLPVFDGINMPADAIREDSRKINEAVHQGWMTNPIKALADSFGAFVKTTGLGEVRSDMSQEMIDEIGQALDFTDNLKPEELAERVQSLLEQVNDVASDLDARKAVLAKVNTSTDHMASAGGPFVKTDGIELPADPEAAVVKLNEMLNEERGKTKAPVAAVSRESDMGSIIETLGQVDETTGARVITRDDLAAVAHTIDIPLDHRSMIQAALGSAQTNGWKIVSGTKETIGRYIAENGLSQPDVTGDVHGFAIPVDKIVYLFTADSETLAHELIHAATLETVYDYYSDASSVSPAVGDAIQRTEVLMDQFLGLDPKQVPDDVREDFVFAREHILNSQADHPSQAVRDTAQLNEFMAWVLSNQNLAQLAETTRAHPLARIAKAALALLKKMFRSGLMPVVNEDILSNLRFNTRVIMNSKPQTSGDVKDLASLVQFQAANTGSGYGSNDRLVAIEMGLLDRMRAALAKARAVGPVAGQKLADAHIDMYRISSKVRRNFQTHFGMTQQEGSLFETLLVTFAVDADLNGPSMTRLQDMYRHVLSKLEVADFLKDPTSQDPQDLYIANQKFNLIVGNTFKGKDFEGRSTLLPAFLALANVSDEFRAVLQKMDVPKSIAKKGVTLDETLTSLGNDGIDRLARSLSGEGLGTKDIRSALDLITARIADSQADREAYIETFVAPVGNGIDKANQYIIDQMQRLSQKAFDALGEIEDATNNPGLKLAARAGQVLTGIFNEDIGEKQARSTLSLLDKSQVWTPVRELFSEVIGRTNENALIYDMIKASRAFIAKTRQIFREDLPGILTGKFGRALSDVEHTALHSGLLKTDLAALASLGNGRILDILKDHSKLVSETSRLETEIDKLDPAQAAKLKTKARELADFMSSGKVSGNLLRNAAAIANLFGELSTKARTDRHISPKLVDAIDKLVSLYSLGSLSVADAKLLSNLATNEADGLSFTLDYLRALREEELLKDATDRARLNHYKGRSPVEAKSGSSLLLADDREYAQLVARGYIRTATYRGSAAESHRIGMGYYVAPVTGKARFNQGIAQNVRQSLFGVDPVTGFSFNMHNAGRITDQREVASVTARIRLNSGQGEPLMPVYDAAGDVVAYERSLAPEQLTALDYKTNLSRVMGMWRGRQVEEASAVQLNRELIGKLHDIWDKREAGRESEFEDVLVSTDPIVADAVALFTPEMRREIEATFGGQGLMVRKSMTNDVVGYRSASLGDFWTGNTRIKQEIAQGAADVATAIFGKKAYQHFVTGEKLWQNFVSDARTTIVVRSVIVPVANIISNVAQLAARGVPIATIVRTMPKILSQVAAYHANHKREVVLEAEIQAAGSNSTKSKALKAELQSVQDSHRRLSIWALIQAGELSSVTEATVMSDQSSLFEGKLAGYIEQQVDKLPPAVRNAGRYGIISRDTALFQGLQLAVLYGDFLAKAVLYDHLTQKKGKTTEEAKVAVSDEFVNYDRLPGRFRGMLEGNGLIWFWHFKLRSLKIAMSLLRNNPLHALLVGVMPVPDFIGVGNTFGDNILGVAFEGKLHYSIGPLQGIHAHSLNPWVNAVS